MRSGSSEVTISDAPAVPQVPYRSISLTNDQTAAVRAIKDWFNYRTEEQQVFRVFGYAGTGKTTLIKYTIDDLGLDPRDPGDVNFGTFTGKAAYVLRKKGLPCRTIHSLIYRLVQTDWGLPARWELNEDTLCWRAASWSCWTRSQWPMPRWLGTY